MRNTPTVTRQAVTRQGVVQPRRKFLKASLAASLATSGMLSSIAPANAASSIYHKTIPSTGEQLPAIGMGTWLTFDVPDEAGLRDKRAAVLQTFFDSGGKVVDSSPMYGYSEEVIGYCLEKIKSAAPLFAASKIWTPVGALGPGQMRNTEDLWGVKPIDLMHVHNLLSWNKHLPRLLKWKEQGRIRYVGVSTSHGRRHQELASLMRNEPLDFVQLTYNIEQRSVEEVLLPLAADKGIAVIVNRPFQRGSLIDKYANKPLPGIAKELGCSSWAQFMLLFVISHPAVTCAIPATRRVDHMQENMATLQLAKSVADKVRIAMADSISR